VKFDIAALLNGKQGQATVPTAQLLADMINVAPQTGDAEAVRIVLEVVGPSALVGILAQLEMIVGLLETHEDRSGIRHA
jgi:Na+/glutamate symporter